MLTIIAAIASNGCIGQGGQLPWHIPEDLKRFKMLTMGHPVIMGRKTWESIPERFRPLPGRKNIVVTRQMEYPLPPGVERAISLDKALQLADGNDPFVIGGADIYAQAMSHAQRLTITHVERTVKGDAFFPAIDPLAWRETAREPHDGFAFVTYDRIG